MASLTPKRSVTVAVSVPEKTLEHWVSQYVLYRFKSNALVWWPVAGEDVRVQLPGRPGKVILLEIKTATVQPRGRHEVSIDVGQLWDYLQKPLVDQPFYAFPLPRWDGVLNDPSTRAWRRGRPPSELAFSRSGSRLWFADWMVVMTTKEVASSLAGPITPTPKGGPRAFQRLVSIAPTTGVESWALTRPSPQPRGWRDFWDAEVACGTPTWPQQMLVYRHHVPSGQGLDYQEAVEALRRSIREAREFGERWSDSELVSLQPTSPDSWNVVDTDRAHSNDPGEGDDIHERHRVAVFLTAEAIGD